MPDVAVPVMGTVWMVESIRVESAWGNLLAEVHGFLKEIPEFGGGAGVTGEATSTADDSNGLVQAFRHK